MGSILNVYDSILFDDSEDEDDDVAEFEQYDDAVSDFDDDEDEDDE